jgi:hypothetical protein
MQQRQFSLLTGAQLEEFCKDSQVNSRQFAGTGEKTGNFRKSNPDFSNFPPNPQKREK